jgi:colicin import membrane protein
MKRLNILLASTVTGGVMLLSQIGNAQVPAAPAAPAAPQATQPAQQGASDAASGAREGAKAGAQGARDAAKGAAQGARESADGAAQGARESAKGAQDSAKGAAREARDTAKQGTKEARDTAKGAQDSAKGAAREARDTAKQGTKEARDTAKGAAKGARDTAKNAGESAKDAGQTADKNTAKAGAKASDSREFNAESVKVDDLGLSVKESGDQGLLISNISTSGPLARVGFEQNDRIVSVNGQRITRQADFTRYLFADDIRDERVKVIVLRDDVEEVVYVEPAVIIREYETVVVSDRDPIRDFGIVLDDSAADRLYVAKVIADTPADRAGIRRDDEIVAVNDRATETRDDLALMIEKFEDESLNVEVKRERQAKVIKVEYVK